eukprot:TRINITY_DN6345_c0_g1_i1.p1 TRINITY_DN6345_c0_g1~~TRINITY_DN6345_c0_g1_i1.p1  ORF type:complete len:202 (-),score=48.24 TRINITY_DN6345_c0_g1_i1:171-776(-)
MVRTIDEAGKWEIIKNQFVECKDFHDGSCEQASIVKFFSVFQKFTKYYIPIHFIPLILFKRKQLREKPLKTLLHTLIGYVKSLCFLSSYVAILRYVLCRMQNLRRTIDYKNLLVANMFAAPISAYFEPEGRRREIALFALPRFLEGLWNYLKLTRDLKPIPYAENVIFGIAMGLIFYYYQKEETAIKKGYLSFFKKLWGKN